MKRIINFKNFVLALFLMIPLMLISACGGDNYVKKYAWGKTFTYQQAYTTNLENAKNNGSKIGDLLKAEYDHLDLAKASIDGKETDISSIKGSNYEQFIKDLSNLINTEFIKSYQNIIIKVGNQEENKITINNKTYNISTGEFGPYSYKILPQDTTSGINYIGYFEYVLINTPNSTDSKYLFNISTFGEEIENINRISVSIPLDHTIEDPSADDILDSSTGEKIGSKIFIDFIPYFCEAAI